MNLLSVNQEETANIIHEACGLINYLKETGVTLNTDSQTILTIASMIQKEELRSHSVYACEELIDTLKGIRFDLNDIASSIQHS